MSKSFLLSKRDGTLEEVKADLMEFTAGHILFFSYRENATTRWLEFGIRAELVDTIVEDCK